MAYTVDHENIWIKSEEPLTWEQKLDDALNYSDLNINAFDYLDYQPTHLQFHLTSATGMQGVSIKIPYANRLSITQVKHAKICRYDQTSQQWLILNNIANNEKEKQFEFTTDRIGVYGVFVNHYWYSSFTQRMADEYPNWTKVRNSKESTGQLFLNFFGMKLEEVEDYLNWIHDQKYLPTADLHVFDWVKKYKLPQIKQSDQLTFTYQETIEEVKEVPQLQTLREFFFNDKNAGGIIDYVEQSFYTTFDYGTITLQVTSKNQTIDYVLEPIDHHIWNTFDEFGLLVGVQRLHLETNANLKERILDVFRYPSNTTDVGLTNGIARELNLIQRADLEGNPLIWIDDRKDFYLKNSSNKIIDLRTLRMDDQPLTGDQYMIDTLGNIRIFAQHTGTQHTISFIYGIDKYQLYEKENEDLHRFMFNPDGQATSKLLYWVEYINTVAPVMWNRFNWDEGFWDTVSKESTGLGYVPNIWDSHIDSWKNYIFESER